MSEFESSSPEQHLKDTLYHLQTYRELAGVDVEPAIFQGSMQDEFYEQCTVLIDKVTDDRIVITELPLDEVEFDGAAVWISNPLGVEVRQGQWEASPKDVIFWIGESLSVRYFNPRAGVVLPFPTRRLAERIEYPTTINPEPVSESDPRQIPEDFDFLRIPKSDSYTLASGIFDYELENNHRLIASRYGIYKDTAYEGNSRAFDIKLTEQLPGSQEAGPVHSNIERRGEFDREFLLLLNLGEQTGLTVIPWGGGGELQVRGTEFKIRVFREGMIFDLAADDGEVRHCIPTQATQRYIDALLKTVAIAND